MICGITYGMAYIMYYWMAHDITLVWLMLWLMLWLMPLSWYGLWYSQLCHVLRITLSNDTVKWNHQMVLPNSTIKFYCEMGSSKGIFILYWQMALPNSPPNYITQLHNAVVSTNVIIKWYWQRMTLWMANNRVAIELRYALLDC